MPVVKSIACRKVLNSHMEFTNEFLLHLADGAVGAAASPQGETVSVYEGKGEALSPESIVGILTREGCLDREVDQPSFDAALRRHVTDFGRNTTCSISIAFFNALNTHRSVYDLWDIPRSQVSSPRLCLNILNGGRHAYTNPVLSDFPEYLLVARTNQVEEVVAWHAELQRAIAERLRHHPKEIVSGHPVHRFATADNRECFDFLRRVLEELGLTKHFDLMVDASAGDLRSGVDYEFALTNQARYSGEALVEYWRELIREYHVAFLEDPFAEDDLASWRGLTGSQEGCAIIGDNLYSSDAARIRKGAREKWTHGVILKPNQAGTVTDIQQAVEAARTSGQVAITSHRSISTEETFLSLLTCAYQIGFIKIGPLLTDYSSVIRLNAILRFAENQSHVEANRHQHDPARLHGLQCATTLCRDH
jgi:enolase